MYIIIFPDTPLGDEINIYRIHLFFLLINNIINYTNIIIIHLHQDRHFLYVNHFKNIFTSFNNAVVELPYIINYPQYNLLEIFPFPILPYSSINKSTIVNELLYESVFNTSLMPESYYNNIKNDKIIDMIINIPKIKIDNTIELITSNKFIIIHYRNKNQNTDIWDSNVNELSTIINFVLKYTNNIIVFGNIHKTELNCNDNIHFINNLHVYASLLGHKNCTSLITQWSGGGQLCSHFGNKNIQLFYYFNKNQNHYYDFLINGENEICKNSNWFDFINPLNISRIFYKDINEMILRLTSNFDWKFYLDFYPDLRMNGIHTEEQAKYHFL